MRAIRWVFGRAHPFRVYEREPHLPKYRAPVTRMQEATIRYATLRRLRAGSPNA